jgi:hypothetical protein
MNVTLISFAQVPIKISKVFNRKTQFDSERFLLAIPRRPGRNESEAQVFFATDRHEILGCMTSPM